MFTVRYGLSPYRTHIYDLCANLTSKSLAQAYSPVRVKVSATESSYVVKRGNG